MEKRELKFPTVKLHVAFSFFTLFSAATIRADHGPGTSGGGASTQSGETLKPGKFSVELRTDYTEFEDLSATQIATKAAKAGSFDLLDRSFLSTISVGCGVAENFQVGLAIGYYNAVNAREAEFDSGTGDSEIATFDPDGLTDMWLTGKYRFYRGPLGSIAVLGGMKFPTGKFDVKNSAGERVEPSATAGRVLTTECSVWPTLAFSRRDSPSMPAPNTRSALRPTTSSSATASTRAWLSPIGSRETSKSFRR